MKISHSTSKQANKIMVTPKKDGFHMPGEFEPHKGTYMAWPERPDNWRCGGKYGQKVFAQIAEIISENEEVTIITSEEAYTEARKMLSSKIRVVICRTNDAWMRDIGPTFVINDQGDVRGIDWRFNAWGGLVDGLYASWDFDDRVASFICSLEKRRFYRLESFVLEGGSFHVDGEGTAIVTAACLLSKGRNPLMYQDDISDMLKEYLNLEKIIWIPHGIYMDETNEHVDNICTFVRPGEVALAWCDNKEDPQYEYSNSSYKVLCKETDAKGRKLIIHKIVMPSPVFITKEESSQFESVEGSIPRRCGDRQAGSYINYYVFNGGVVMPKFKDPMDDVAKAQIQKLYPERKIMQVYSRDILLGGGNIHCITQQIPKKIKKVEYL